MKVDNIFRHCLMACALLLVSTSYAAAAYFWENGLSDLTKGVRGKNISVCFVGSAVTINPDRVNQVLGYIKEFEYAANIKFNYTGTCAAPVKQANGDDSYAGDIRILIAGAGVAPGKIDGKGCKKFSSDTTYDGTNDGWGSWSNPPSFLEFYRPCLYNLKLGDDPHTPLWIAGLPAGGNPSSTLPYLDHTLHEFGHGLGLDHEHLRKDADKIGCPTVGGGSAEAGNLTPYDKTSVMHYQFITCGINGNYDNKGFSALDKLALHIMYPEDTMTAEFIGTTVVKTSAPIHLVSAWKAQGANMNIVAKNFVWKLAGLTASKTPELSTSSAFVQIMPLELSYTDFLGRKYFYSGKVQVLDAKTYNARIAAPASTLLPLL